MKIKVGKKYRVTHGRHKGDIIEVIWVGKRFGATNYDYKTIRDGNEACGWFEEGSNFSHWLEPIEETKVVILRDGNTVTAAQYIDGAKVNTGVAKCSPEDSFDFGVGAKLALERLFKSGKPSMSREDVYNKTKEVLSAAPLKFDWDKFSSGDLYVELNRKNMDSFLKECEERGYKWMSGELATERNLFRDYDKMPDGAKFIAAILGVAFNDKPFVRVFRGKLTVNNEPLSDVEVCKW